MADERYKIQRHKGEEIEALLDKLQTLVGSVEVDKSLPKMIEEAIANERIDLSNLILSGSQEGVTIEDLHKAHKLWFVTGGAYSDVYIYDNMLYYDVYEWGRELKRVFKQISMRNGVMTVVDTTEVTLN